MKRRYKWICEQCGSDNVMAEGQAFWNREAQEWNWEWDQTFCHNCQDVVIVTQEELPPVIPDNIEII